MSYLRDDEYVLIERENILKLNENVLITAFIVEHFIMKRKCMK